VLQFLQIRNEATLSKTTWSNSLNFPETIRGHHR